MKIENEELIFSTGKRVYANNEFVGLSDDFSLIATGWDDTICREKLSPEERCELADYMIAQWTMFKEEA